MAPLEHAKTCKVKGAGMKLVEMAERLRCELRGDGTVEITGVNGIEDAGPGELTFVAHAKYLAKLPTTKAAAVILTPETSEIALPSLRTANPYFAFAQALGLFYVPTRPRKAFIRLL